MGSPLPQGTWETSDLGTAAYVHARGSLKILAVRRRPRTRFCLFRFADPDRRGPALSLEYANSAERRFDEAVRTLKKLMHDAGEEVEAWNG